MGEYQKDKLNSKKNIERFRFRAAAARPILRIPIEKMTLVADPKIQGIGTDGWNIYYDENRNVTEADHQHLLMHCLFLHMAPESDAARSLYDLACDMTAEYRRTEIFPAEDKDSVRRAVSDSLPAGCDPHEVSSVLKGLMELREDELDELKELFVRDDHRYWYEKPCLLPDFYEQKLKRYLLQNPDEESQNRSWRNCLKENRSKEWENAGKGIEGNTGGTKFHGLASGSREEKMILRQIGKHDFSRYLKRFSAQREEIILDPGSFDYIPYYYGLKNYGNLPFVEPLEYSESNKVEELVIAIDTSGSCHYETVERFLAEIEKILMNSDTFFRKMTIHIIQCDSIIQDHTVIHSYDDWKRYLKDLKIKGRGGTDFTPVFRLVEEIREKGELMKLKGLLYFTDGDGVYPKEKTSYETAFVFTDPRALDYNIPEWIVRLCLDQPALISL